MDDKKTDINQNEIALEKKESIFPTRFRHSPFRSLERYIDGESDIDISENIREIKGPAIQKLELLDQIHNDLVRQARSIVEKAREDLRLHSVRMFCKKNRGKVYYLYRGKNSEEFFSILEPEEYARADSEARYLGAYRLNDDSSWTHLEE
ncbi:MAG: DUF2452 domain-containing protein [bacterium]